MLEINTIAEFMELPTPLRDEVQKAIRAKDRLDDWLRSQNRRLDSPKTPIESHWEKCKSCSHWDQPGWVWREEVARDNSDIHPSQIHKCLKALWYSCAGYSHYLEETIDARDRMVMDMGTAWHLVMQRYGAKGAWGPKEYYRAEVPIDPDAMTFDNQPINPLATQLWIKGHVDAIVDKYEIQGVPGIGDVSIRLVHEYKTINESNYSKLLRPKSEHKFQAMIYAAVFNIPIVVYIYTNKNDCKNADFPVPFDHTIWNEIVAKIKQIQHHVEVNQVPPWELTSALKDPAECMNYCGYQKICQPPLKQLKRSS